MSDRKEFSKACYDKFINSAKTKNRTLEPWNDLHINYLWTRLSEERQELLQALKSENYDDIMDECTDVSNFAWFIYEWAKRNKKQ